MSTFDKWLHAARRQQPARFAGAIVLILCLAPCLGMAQLSFAAEDADEAVESTQQPASEDTPAATASNSESKQRPVQADKTKNRDTEIFRPSEEISEDFAVSFPVDI